MAATRNLVRFLFEAGRLKTLPRSGWGLVGISNCESVAEHSFRTAIIGFVIALNEGADPYKTASLCLFHDLPETRMGDFDHLSARYIEKNEIEEKIKIEQCEFLDANLRDAILELNQDKIDDESIERCVLHDADKIECVLQALEYQQQGSLRVEPFLKLDPNDLKTKTGRELLTDLKEVGFCEWWQHDE